MAVTGTISLWRNALLKSMLLSRSARNLAKVEAFVSKDCAAGGVGTASRSAPCAELRGGRDGGGRRGGGGGGCPELGSLSGMTWDGRRGVLKYSELRLKIGNAFS